ncbi:MAG: DNA polymerase III subunit chi [Proteobacteria bacterium]|nr:DNA polymerase III subunit chi [Pseudomonadota bacterium]
MTRVIFYVGIADRRAFLYRFLHRKVFLPQQTALIYGSEEAVTELDRMLWEEGFLPHQRLDSDSGDREEGGDGEESGNEAPIILTSTAPAPEYSCDIFISLTAEVPKALIGRFNTCVDIIGTSETSKQAGRERYRYFKDNGYQLEVVDMSKK